MFVGPQKMCGFSDVGAVGEVHAGKILGDARLTNVAFGFVIPVDSAGIGDGVTDIDDGSANAIG